MDEISMHLSAIQQFINDNPAIRNEKVTKLLVELKDCIDAKDEDSIVSIWRRFDKACPVDYRIARHREAIRRQCDIIRRGLLQ